MYDSVITFFKEKYINDNRQIVLKFNPNKDKQLAELKKRLKQKGAKLMIIDQ